MIGRCSPKAVANASKSLRPGPRTHLPFSAVASAAGMFQAAAKPRKWSRRIRSTWRKLRFSRATHQPKPVASIAFQSYSGLPQCWPVGLK